MRIYLDNCCFNRPFDDQRSVRIRIETEAKIFIQSKIIQKEIELVWSYILDYENKFNPFEERKNAIQLWKKHAVAYVDENEKILETALKLTNYKMKPKDALHVACAVNLRCPYFLTTDDILIKKGKNLKNIEIINPVDYINLLA